VLDENTYCQYFFSFSRPSVGARVCKLGSFANIFYANFSKSSCFMYTRSRVEEGREGSGGGGALHSPAYKDTHREKERIEKLVVKYYEKDVMM
jgi:hypothetical protein